MPHEKARCNMCNSEKHRRRLHGVRAGGSGCLRNVAIVSLRSPATFEGDYLMLPQRDYFLDFGIITVLA